MKLKSLILAFSLLILLFASLPAAFAQSSTGTLEGTVLDAQKLPIYNALVTVVQTDTKRTLKTRTTRAGVYSFPGLDAGGYSITVVAPSFESAAASSINIDAASDVTQDFTLHPGSNDVSITVYSSADLVERDNSAVSNTVSKELIESIPLADHSSLGLVTLIPGVVGDPAYSTGVMSELPGIYTNPATPGASLSIGGSRPGLVSQLIDGFDITQSGYPRAGISFTPFSIKGISAQMAAMQAEFGRTAGGIINQASQAGGAQYHGTFEYRHYDPGFGQAYRTGSNQPSDLHQTLYGGVISGPVGIPKWKKLKDTYFLFTYEPLRGRSVIFSRARVLAPDELNGQFFNPTTGPNGVGPAAGNGDGFISYDNLNTTQLIQHDYTTAVNASIKAGTGAQAGQTVPLNPAYYLWNLDPNGFPTGNKFGVTATPIPNIDVSAQVARNPLAQFLKAHYPTPSNSGKYINFDNALGTYRPDGTNSYAARGVVNNDDRYSIRVDHTFGNNDHIFGRYSTVPVSGIRYGYLGPSNPLNNIVTDTITSRNWALNYIHLFGGHIVNESRLSYIRGNRYRIPPPVDLSADNGPQFGLAPATAGVGFPALSFSDGQAVGGGGGFQDGGRSLDEAYGTGNTTTIILGRHQLKFGAEFRALQLNRTDGSNTYGGTYLFSNQDTAASTTGATSTGNAIASFDLGLINSFTTAGVQPFYYRWKYIAGFIEDSWKALPTLTINYGLRYNLEYPRKEKNNLQGTFLPDVVGHPTMANGQFSSATVSGGVAFSGTNGLGTTIFPVNYKGFEPRFGIAFSPRSWIVMKSGFALIHAPLTGVGNSIDPAFTPSAQVVLQGGTGGVNNNCGASGPTCYTALSYMTNPVAAVTRVGAITNQNPQFNWATNALLPYVDQNNAVPYVEIWNAGVQFLLSKATVIEANYIGQRAIHLYSPALGANLPSQASLLTLQQQHFCFSCQVTVDYGQQGPETALQHQSPYTQFYNNPIYRTYNRTASSNYHGLYITVKRQATKDLTLIGGFTWSKSLDTNSTPSPDLVGIDNFGLTFPQNAYTSQGDYGVSSFDQPARVTAGYTYNFPVGRGHQWFTHGILNQIFGGFTTSGYFSAQSGLAPDVGEGNNGFFLSQNPIDGSAGHTAYTSQTLGALGASQLYNHLRPNLIPGVPLINPHWSGNKLGLKADAQYGNGFLNINAFQAPGSRDNPAYGNAPAHLANARSPRSINFDASMRKNIAITPRVRMQLWTDILNVANHPNYFTVGGNVFSGSLLPANIGTATAPPSATYPITGPFLNNANFSVPSAFSGTRIITVGGSVSF